jgi:hypothetical protein
MKHSNKSASSGELACPHLSDHPTQKAKSQRSGDPAYSLNGLRPKRINHGRSVVCSDHHTSALFLTSTAELRTRFTQTSADIGVCPSSGTATFDYLKTDALLQPVEFTLFLSFSPSPNPRNYRKYRVLSFSISNFFRVFRVVRGFTLHQFNLRTCLISSPGGEDQDEGVRSFHIPRPPSTLNPEIPQPIHSRSACSAYPYEKIRNRVAVGKDSAFRSKPLVVRFAEILLRFAETSQQTLRHFSLLPATYINFVETTIREANNSYWAPDLWRAGAAKNALKSKLLRHLTHTTIVDSNFTTRGFRAKLAARSFRTCLISSPGGEDQDEGDLSAHSRKPLFQIKNVTDASRLPVQRLPASSTEPSTLNPEIPQPIPCADTSLILLGARTALSATSHPFIAAKNTRLAHKVARKLARKWHVGIFKNPSKTRKLARKTHSFFSEEPNVTPVPPVPLISLRKSASNLSWPRFAKRTTLAGHLTRGGLGQPISLIRWFKESIISAPISRREMNFSS